MREILFVFATWTAAAGFLLCALLNSSIVLWEWTAYTSSMALFALAHGRGKRWGSVGSIILASGLLALSLRGFYLQLLDRDHVLIPANWMAGFYVMGMGLNLLCAILLAAVIYWLAASRRARYESSSGKSIR